MPNYKGFKNNRLRFYLNGKTVCLKDALDHPAVGRLRAALQAPAWAQALGSLPGYEPSPQAGEVLALTQALPWWNFRQAKKPVGDGLQRA